MIYLYGDKNCEETKKAKKLLFKKASCFVYYPLEGGISEALNKHNLDKKYKSRSLPLVIEFKLNRKKALESGICETKEIEIGGYNKLKKYFKQSKKELVKNEV